MAAKTANGIETFLLPEAVTIRVQVGRRLECFRSLWRESAQRGGATHTRWFLQVQLPL